MVQLCFLIVACMVVCTAGQSPSCCELKTMGATTYSLVLRTDTSSYNCMDNCVYQTAGDPEKYCFAEKYLESGETETECADDDCPNENTLYSGPILKVDSSATTPVACR